MASADSRAATVAAAVSPGLAQLIGAESVRIGLAAAWSVAAVVAVVASPRSGNSSIAIDTALIGALRALAPPLVGFALWFGGWHALRHSARMLSREPGCAALLTAGRPRAAVRRLAKLAAAPSIAAVVAVVALGGFTMLAPEPATVVAEVLRVVLALTVPHMVVVMWLDHSQRRVA